MPRSSPRKRPRQERSRATVDALLDATAQVLTTEGYDKASTNRIARVAGVSVGSLYQYFPNKEALVMAVVQRHVEEMLALLQTSIAELGGAPIPEAVRTYVRAMLAAHAVDPELHRALTQQVMYLDMEALRVMQRASRAVVRGWLEEHRERFLPTNLDVAAQVLVSAVEGVLHGPLVEEPETLFSSALEDELVALILRYLLGEQVDGGVA